MCLVEKREKLRKLSVCTLGLDICLLVFSMQFLVCTNDDDGHSRRGHAYNAELLFRNVVVDDLINILTMAGKSTDLHSLIYCRHELPLAIC